MTDDLDPAATILALRERILALEDQVLALKASPQRVHWKPRRQVYQLRSLGMTSQDLKALGWQWIDGKWVGHGPQAEELKERLEATLG